MKIIGTGLYAPGEPLTHEEVMAKTGLTFDTEKLEEKLGMKKRHIARLRGLDETTADFAEKASRCALEDAGLKPDDLDLFIVATDTPEFISPPTSMLLQGRLQGGERPSGCFDVNGSCSGFVSAFQTASRLADASSRRIRALVVGVYNMAAYFRSDDPFGFSLFADGAGAWILEGGGEDPPPPDDNGSSCFRGGSFRADGTQWDFIGVYAGGTRRPVTAERIAAGEVGLQLLQNLPGNRNVELWPKVVRELLDETGFSLDRIDHLLFTQINRSVIEQVMELLGKPLERTTCVMDRYGYTGSACIPMAFHHARKEGRIARGDDIVLVASGAGLGVSAALFTY